MDKKLSDNNLKLTRMDGTNLSRLTNPFSIENLIANRNNTNSSPDDTIYLPQSNNMSLNECQIGFPPTATAAAAVAAAGLTTSTTFSSSSSSINASSLTNLSNFPLYNPWMGYLGQAHERLSQFFSNCNSPSDSNSSSINPLQSAIINGITTHQFPLSSIDNEKLSNIDILMTTTSAGMMMDPRIFFNHPDPRYREKLVNFVTNNVDDTAREKLTEFLINASNNCGNNSVNNGSGADGSGSINYTNYLCSNNSDENLVEKSLLTSHNMDKYLNERTSNDNSDHGNNNGADNRSGGSINNCVSINGHNNNIKNNLNFMNNLLTTPLMMVTNKLISDRSNHDEYDESEDSCSEISLTMSPSEQDKSRGKIIIVILKF